MRSASNSGKRWQKIKVSRLFQDLVKITGAVPSLIWLRPKVYYAADKKKSLVKTGVLYASNHIAMYDPVLLYCVLWRRRLHFLITKDLYKNDLLSIMFTAVGCIQVDKENFSLQSMHTTVDRLKAGKAVLIFPEGQLNGEEKSLSYKSGAVLMAKLANVPIQPVYIVPTKKWYHRHAVVVGEPMDISGLCSRFPTVEELQKVSDQLRSRELELKQYYEARKQKRGK